MKKKSKKILFIWHGAVVADYQIYIKKLASDKNYEIILLIPESFYETGRIVRAFTGNTEFRTITLPVKREHQIVRYTFKGLGKVMRRERPDIIHLFEEPWSFCAFWAVFWKAVHAPHAAILFQTFENLHIHLSFKQRIIEKIVHSASRMAIACSDEIKNVLQEKGYKKEISMIPIGVNKDNYIHLHETDITRIREKLHIGGTVIGYVGRFSEEKGVLDLLCAFKRINEDNCTLLCIGSGGLKDDIIAFSKKETVRNKNKRIIILDPFSPDKLGPYYACMDILVLPSRTTPRWKEQFGRTLVEAMLCGVNVIGSDSGEIPNVIGDGGLVFPEGDVESLKDSIELLLHDKEKAEELKKKGKERALMNYTWEIAAEKVLQLYNSF
ncbi:glycosyltransferase family 4 protein [Spirochaetota bacterium]